MTRYVTWREVNVYYLSVKGSVKVGVNFSVMFHSTNENDFCSETGSSTASLLCGSTVGYPSASLASCPLCKQKQIVFKSRSECETILITECRRNSRRLGRKYGHTGSATARLSLVEHERMRHKVYRHNESAFWYAQHADNARQTKKC